MRAMLVSVHLEQSIPNDDWHSVFWKASSFSHEEGCRLCQCEYGVK